MQSQVIAIGVAIGGVEDVKGNPGKVFRCRHPIENDRFVSGQAGKKLNNRAVPGVGQEGVIPGIHQLRLGQILDPGKVHDHAVGRVAGFVDDVAGQGDFDSVAVTVQVSTLALVIGNAVTGVKFQAAGDEHQENQWRGRARIIQ